MTMASSASESCSDHRREGESLYILDKSVSYSVIAEKFGIGKSL